MKRIYTVLILVFFTITVIGQTVTIIPQSSSWKYLDNGTNQGISWRTNAFNDATWANGNAEMGYGDGDEATVVSYGSNPSNKYVTTYFRKSFTVDNPATYNSLSLGVVRDDGIVVYINGTEVYRNNMPAGTISYNTMASSDAPDESSWHVASLSPSVLLQGTNVIAIEVHQLSVSSSDISFNARLTGLTGTPGTCATPASVSTASITTSSASVSWAAVAGATSYNLRYRIIGSSLWISKATTSTTSSLTGLAAGSNYEVQVQAVCTATGAFSASTNFTTVAGTCATPSSLSTASITTTSATVSWAAVSGATSYNIQYRIVGTPTWSTKTSTSNTRSLTSLTPGSNYEFQVQAVCSVTGTFSPSSNFTTLANTCATPTSISATSITTTSASASWAAVSGATSYKIQYRIVGTTTWSTKTTTSTTKSLTPLTPGSNYEFQVQAICNATGAFSQLVNFTTLSNTCATPGSLITSAITTSSANASWASVQGATSYNIRYRIVGASTWLSKTSTSTTKSLTALTSGSNYEFQVQAVCSITGAYSASANFTTLAQPTCATPSALSATSITTTTANISWAAVSGATNYNIQYRIVGNPVWLATTSATATKSLSGLTASSNYEFQVQAVCTITGVFSASANFTTLAEPTCGTPDSLSSSAITTNSATISWASISGATNYNIQYRIVGNPTWMATTSATATKSLSGLTASSNYEFQVQAVCSLTGAYSASANFTTLAQPTCGTPSALGATSITTTTANISWAAVSGATNYNIQYRIVGNPTWLATTSATATKSLSGLTPSSNYEFQIQAVCSITGVFSASANFTTLAEPTCGTPESLSSSSITTTSAAISWAAVSGATNYNVQYRVVGSPAWLATTSATATKSLSGLTASSNYEFQVQAVCTITGVFSASANFTTLAEPTCGTPDSLSSSSITTTSATISWAAVSGATNYNIQYRIVGSPTWLATISVNATKSLLGLTASSNYEFQVQAVCAITGVFSASANFTTLAEPTCGTPDSLSSSSITTTSAVISWAAVSGATNYNIQYRIVGSPTWLATTSATASKSLLGLTASSNYEFQVQAVCAITGVFSASANFTTLAEPTCGTPDLLSSSSITTTSAVISWAAVSGATNYNIQYRIVGSPTWLATTSATASKSLSGLTALSNYEFQVQAVCAITGVFSASANFTTLAEPTCGTPDSLSSSSITTTSATISWGAVSGATNYNIQYRIVGGPAWLATTSATATKSLSGLTASSNYEFQIQAVCAITGVFSASTNFTTLAAPTCSTPTSLSAASITSTSATVSWGAVSGATNYNIQYRIVGGPAWLATTSATTSKLLSGLTASSNYEFQIQAVCAITGIFSPSANFTTLSATTCATPTALAASAITMTSASVSWAAVPGATSYNIQYRKQGTSTWTTKTSTSTTRSLTSLLENTSYEYQVQAVCSATGGFSALATFTTLPLSSNYLVAANSSWKYLDNGTNQGTAWRASSFNDATWQTGNAELGYGDGDEATVVSYGPNSSGKYVTTYFRKSFSVTDPASYPALSLSVVQDDGAVVYINGTEVYRYNMPAGTIAYNSLASADVNDETAWITVPISPTVLLAGTNQIAVEIHQQTTTSSDITFNAKLYVPSELPTCATPVSLTVASATSSSAELSWGQVSGATSYNIRYRLMGSTTWTNTTSATALKSLTGLAANSYYEWQVQAVCSSTGTYSAVVNFTTLATGGTTATLLRGAYLQKLSPVSITIRWRTNIPTNSAVQYGADLTYGSTVLDETLTSEHIVTLTGLTPSKKYFYTIGSSTQTLQGDLRNNFSTAPVTGSVAPVRIWALGDFGMANEGQAEVRDAYLSYTGAKATNLWIWLGDDAYDLGTDAQFQAAVFEMYPDQLKSMALFPAPGNHDYAEVDYLGASSLTTNFPYFSIFSMPENGESGGVASHSPKYYSYDYANVHFISLDSYGAPNHVNSPMHTWLSNDLAANTQRWTVVYFHHAPYSKGSHDSNTEIDLKNMRTNIVPLLESYHVDLVLSGHSHNNERSYLMKGHYGSSSTFTPAMKVSPATNDFIKTPPFDGTVYAVCGTSGGNGDTTQPGYPMQCMFFNNLENACSLVIDVNGDLLACKYLASTGVVVDQFTITKQGLARMASPSASDDGDGSGPIAGDSFNVFLSANTINLDYTLDENAEVEVKLFNALGQTIMTFDQIPVYQSKGDHNFIIPQPNYQLSNGLYIMEMVINGQRQVKKVYVK
jgi:hypothetical protein